MYGNVSKILLKGKNSKFEKFINADSKRPKKPLFGKKRKFQEQKSFSFGDFHNDAKMLSEEWKASEPDGPSVEIILEDMKVETFAATLRNLEDCVDDEVFGRFFRGIMAKTHKTAPEFKALVHEFYSKPWKAGNIA